MSVAKMELVNIIGRMDSLDPVIFACGKTGVSQPDDTLSFFSDTTDFTSVVETNPYTDPLTRLEGTISRAGGELKMVPVDVTPDMDKQALLTYVEQFSGRITDLTRQRGQLSLRKEALSKDIEQFKHFFGLGIDLDAILACKMIKVRFGRLPKESAEKLKMYDANPYVLFFTGAIDAEYEWGVYFAPIDFADDIDRIFSSLYFERLRIPAAIGTPEEIAEHLNQEMAQADKEFQKLDEKIKAVWDNEKADCLRIYSQLRLLSYYFSARRYAAKYNDKFIITGWIPAKEEKPFRIALDAIDGIDYNIERAGNDTHHTPPVKLKNPGLFKPFEFFVDIYGLPRYSEIDPTIFIALTYTLLFGIMFGDLGQGICVAVIGWLMWKYKKMAIGKILVPCGISASIFGTVFGSVFGFEHVLDPLYKALFGLSEKPIEVMNPTMTPKILLASGGIGLALIIIAMFLNVYSSLKRRDYVSGIFGANGVAGLTFYVSLVFGLIGKLAGFDFMTLPYVLALIVVPLLLVFLQEPLGKLVKGDPHWKPESWGEYCLQSFFELFETLLSYLSNSMSFLRVGAFVLVHAGMMMAVFTLAGLTSGLLGGSIYILIIVLGNGLVMVMEALLVAIQVLRLEFYEMFSRYYNGDGRPYKPLQSQSEEKLFSEKA